MSKRALLLFAMSAVSACSSLGDLTTATYPDNTTTTAPGASVSSVVETPTSAISLPPAVSSTEPPTANPGTETTAPVDIMSQYRGELGNYGIDEVLAEASISPPVRSESIEPLTGLAGSAGGPAVVVKVDNSSKASPQSGLNAADIVVEEEVEWGITRLALVFHSSSAVVGPIRSARTTDISFLSSLGNPAFVYSGANRLTDTLILRQAVVQNFSAARSGSYWREGARQAPANLFADTASFSSQGSAPAPWFFYRGENDPVVGEEATEITLTLGVTDVVWKFVDGVWVRAQRGSPHLTDNGAQAEAANVVVASTRRVDTGMVDSAGGVVPEFVWAGTGAVTVYSGNRRIEGTWTRPTLGDVAILVDQNGQPIRLVPGRTWVELVAN